MFTILCIEDDADHRLMVHTILIAQGFTIALARNGDEGVALAKAIRPDLILLDLYMPKMDGFSAMKSLKEDPLTRSIPIIVVSAWLSGDHRQRALEAGAIDIVAKPYDPEALADLIQKRLAIPLKPAWRIRDAHPLEI
jgi:CheY-like chemotaxis protein